MSFVKRNAVVLRLRGRRDRLLDGVPAL